MCFSAPVSFTAAAVLGTVGIATLYKNPERKRIFLAMVPFLFALQQLMEGFLWILIGTEPTATIKWLIDAVTYGYLTFAFLIWPVWIPFSLLIAEKQSGRKKVLSLFLGGGIALTFYALFQIEGNDVMADISHQHLSYALITPFSIHYLTYNAIYTAIVVIPCLISSLRYMWVFALLIFGGWLIAALFYLFAFTSVWCFFSAIASLALYRIIRS